VVRDAAAAEAAPSRALGRDTAVGEVVLLEIGPAAHGGHCVARLDGRVVFVRHTLPGEVVRARMTEVGGSRRFWRADAVDILEPSADRVPSVWPTAGPGGVGGGELAHVALPAQRRWKAGIVTDVLRRIGGIEREVDVEAAPGDDARGGLGWRTRITLAVDPRGRAGMYRYRSRDVIPLRDMPLAAPAIADLDLFGRRWPAGSRIEAVAPVGGDRPLVLLDGEPLKGERRAVRERVVLAGREHVYKVSGSGFWQVHDAAPAVLAEAVLQAAGPLEGAHVLDLYAGSGLFTVPLAEAVGAHGHVDAVEGDVRAVRDARRNVHALPRVAVHGGDVAEVIGDLAVGPGAVVVLDPPRTGAGAEVTAAIAATEPARIVYVACDPAALARDLRVAASRGYGLTSLRAVDLFPHTHHVECVAVLERA
jgi:tRNA/tmRNA/rRNA uracil-C5-methylase (TrmA/RlmC/RlmD family)